MKQENNILKNDTDMPLEQCDDNVVVGLGRMLSEARETMGLSQQQVADKLNFRTTLVEAIEAEEFDLSLPAAFNRGYLKNYAKLVNISQDDIISRYDQLGVVQQKCADMQSFSKGTEKQAEHNMLMWISYLILIALITATVVWWYQAPSAQPAPMPASNTSEVSGSTTNIVNDIQPSSVSDTDADTSQALDKLSNAVADENTPLTASTEALNIQTLDDAVVNESINQATGNGSDNLLTVDSTLANSVTDIENTGGNTETAGLEVILANVVFTFSGDCWVNIYDASGERIAWGVKKSGYVMTVSGQAPFNVTLGKPELVQIAYNDAEIDMSAFNAGNIAKFSLPLTP
jgi:cytoskeleton protein RodZ